MQTYDEILKHMTEKYTELSGIVPDERSDIGIRLRVVAGEVYSNMVNAQWLKRQMFHATAEGEYLDMHAAQRGLERREAAASFGEVRFYTAVSAAADIGIPAGTVVACPISLLRFETTEDAVIVKGKNSVSVKARSIGKGKKYNILEGKATVMVTPPSGVDGVTNTAPFSGGCDRESDQSLRERISYSLRFPANSANCAYYEGVAESMEGVSSAGAVSRARGIGTVDVYIAADGAQASDETVAQVQAVLTSLREVNVDVLVKKAEPVTVNVYLDIAVATGYDFDDVKARCVAAVEEYISSRGVGGEVLMCQISECVYHIDGVKELSFADGVNRDYRADKSVFTLPGSINISEMSI